MQKGAGNLRRGGNQGKENHEPARKGAGNREKGREPGQREPGNCAEACVKKLGVLSSELEFESQPICSVGCVKVHAFPVVFMIYPNVCSG